MSVAVFVVPILILAALALGVLVYYICYKAAINRKLRAEESGAHVPMASMESVFKVVVVIGVIVMYSSLNSKLVDLRSELRNTKTELYDKIYALQYDLYEMKEAAKKEASVISETFYDFGELDTQNHTVEMKFFVIPKSYSAETDVVLNYGGESIALMNEGNGRFSGSKTYPLYDEVWDEGMISITENGVTRTEVWEEAPKGSKIFECLPQLVVARSYMGCGERKNKVSMEGELHIVSSEKNAAPFQNIKLYVKNNDEIIDEMSIDDGHISFDLSYPVEKGDRITMYVTGVDEYGYLHERNIYRWDNNEMSADISYEEVGNMYRIYTPDGRVLTQ